MSPTKLYLTAVLFATIPLFLGIVLFLCWYLPRSFYALDYPHLERIGFFCYLFFLAGLLIAAVLLLIYWVQSHTLIQPKVFLAIAMVIAGYFIGQRLVAFALQQKEKAFVRIENRSGRELLCNLHPYFANMIKLFTVKDGNSKMFIYQPQYNVVHDERDLRLKEAYLDITDDTTHMKLVMPPVGNGTCKRLILDQHLKLQEYE